MHASTSFRVVLSWLINWLQCDWSVRHFVDILQFLLFHVYGRSIQNHVCWVAKHFGWFDYIVRVSSLGLASLWWITLIKTPNWWTLGFHVSLLLFNSSKLWWKIASSLRRNQTGFVVSNWYWKIWLCTPPINFESVGRGRLCHRCNIAVENCRSSRSWSFFLLWLTKQSLVLSVT